MIGDALGFELPARFIDQLAQGVLEPIFEGIVGQWVQAFRGWGGEEIDPGGQEPEGRSMRPVPRACSSRCRGEWVEGPLGKLWS